MLTKICASKFRGLVLVSDSSTYKYDFSPEKTYFREKENSCFQAISNFSKEKFFQTQTLVMNGDVSFTKKWNKT